MEKGTALKPTHFASTSRSIRLLFLMLVAVASALESQVASHKLYNISAAPFPVRSPQECSFVNAWYNPEVYTLPNGARALIGQGARYPGPSNYCHLLTTDSIDSLWSGKTTAAGSSTWQLPSANSCPSIIGLDRSCPLLYPAAPADTPGASPKKYGPTGGPSIVKAGAKYYAAYNGGNADFLEGRIYLDATDTLSVSPLLMRKFPPANACTFFTNPGGFTEVNVVFDSADTSFGTPGTFYFYTGLFRASGGPRESWAFRVPYSSTSATGLGTQRQVWKRSTGWVNTTGRLVFPGDPAVPGEPVLTFGEGVSLGAAAFGYGLGDIKWDAASNKWLRVYLDQGNTQMLVQTATVTGLRTNVWSSPTSVDMASLQVTYPNPRFYSPGIWFGQNQGRTGWWSYNPVNNLACTTPFLGLGIAEAQLVAPSVSWTVE